MGDTETPPAPSSERGMGGGAAPHSQYCLGDPRVTDLAPYRRDRDPPPTEPQATPFCRVGCTGRGTPIPHVHRGTPILDRHRDPHPFLLGGGGGCFQLPTGPSASPEGPTRGWGGGPHRCPAAAWGVCGRGMVRGGPCPWEWRVRDL